MRIFPLIITTVSLITLFLAFFVPLQAQQTRELHIDAGVRLSSERDYGYSPLMYTGTEAAAVLSFVMKRPHITNEVTVGFSTGNLTNRFGTGMQVYDAGINTFTFYHANKPSDSGWHWGWTNKNAFGLRDNEAITNYNSRNEYFTSFGPAVRYQLPFELFKRNFSFQTTGNVQLLGFTVLSSYVTSSPQGYINSNNSAFQSFVESLGLFHPGNVLSGSINSGLNYRFKSQNSISLNYQYDYLRLKGMHLVEKSKGKWVVSIIVII